MPAAPRAADRRGAISPRDPRRARRLLGAGLTALLHVAVIAGLLHAGAPPPPATPGTVSVRLLPALATSPPAPRAEPRPATPPRRPPALPRPLPTPPAEPAAQPAAEPAASAPSAPERPDRATPLARPALAAAATADTPADLTADAARIAAAYVQALWTRIAAARPTGTMLQGEALVGFTLDADGRLVTLELLQSSGNGLLDRLALRTVRRAAPFPPPPAAAGRAFRIAFHFG